MEEKDLLRIKNELISSLDKYITKYITTAKKKQVDMKGLDRKVRQGIGNITK